MKIRSGFVSNSSSSSYIIFGYSIDGVDQRKIVNEHIENYKIEDRDKLYRYIRIHNNYDEPYLFFGRYILYSDGYDEFNIPDKNKMEMELDLEVEKENIIVACKPSFYFIHCSD